MPTWEARKSVQQTRGAPGSPVVRETERQGLTGEDRPSAAGKMEPPALSGGPGLLLLLLGTKKRDAGTDWKIRGTVKQNQIRRTSSVSVAHNATRGHELREAGWGREGGWPGRSFGPDPAELRLPVRGPPQSPLEPGRRSERGSSAQPREGRASPPPGRGRGLQAAVARPARRSAQSGTPGTLASLGRMRLPVLLLGVATCYAPSLCLGGARDELLFKTWMYQNNKQYSSEVEYWQRLQVFAENKQRIDRHNAGNHTFQMGLNQFADMTFAEFQKEYLWQEPQNCSATKGNFVSGAGPSPSAIDWRKKGNYVTPVKNQGPCGSCWTFSTTGCLESTIAIQTGKLLNLAEQQLVDCAQNFNNHGCSGGLPSQAFEYILYNKGLMGEETYPYRAKNGTCHFQPQKAVAFVKDVVNITLNDEQGLMEAVGRYNPVSFAFEVVGDFMFYEKGVYSSVSSSLRAARRRKCNIQDTGQNPLLFSIHSTKCHNTPDKVNHAVLAVGYGEESGVPYWIVKNSWGPSWGVDG
ncbi:hypothetical protein lerEdw1_011096 [Lerista edwardsae]|nr:hypothetical protein lerEdw1_011096 [Lerista edwardsae]